MTSLSLFAMTQWWMKCKQSLTLGKRFSTERFFDKVPDDYCTYYFRTFFISIWSLNSAMLLFLTPGCAPKWSFFVAYMSQDLQSHRIYDAHLKKTAKFKNHSTYTVNRRVKISPLTWIQTNGELDKSKRARFGGRNKKNTLIAKREELRERRRGSNSRVKFPLVSF